MTRLSVLVFILAACGQAEPSPQETRIPTSTSVSTQNPVPTIPPSATTASSSETPTPFIPSPTAIPLAAKVNGEEITVADFQAELARYRASSGTGLATSGEEVVLNDMIDQLLLTQGAAAAGFVVDEARLQSRIEQLNIGEQELTDWMANHGYTEESFRQAFERAISVAWMRDQIIAEVPETAEQVHARQILLYNLDQANDVLARLDAGADFAGLSAEYHPTSLGELGWFPRGYLFEADVAEAAFALQQGEYSPVIETDLGFHIVQAIERDPQRRLNPEARLMLQAEALEQWLVKRREQSEVIITLP